MIGSVRIEADFPAQAARGGFAAAGYDDGGGEFAIDRQQVRRRIACNRTADPGNLADHTLHLVPVEQPQQPVHFYVVVVPVRGESDEGVSPDQAAKAMGIGAAGWHAVCFVDHQSGNIAMTPEQPGQPIQHLLVREPTVPGGDDRLHLLKLSRLDDGLEGPLRPYPHLGAIGDSLAIQLEGALV